MPFELTVTAPGCTQYRHRRSARLAGLILVHGGASGEAALGRLQFRRPGALFNLRFSEYLRRQPRGGQPLDLG